MRSSSIAPWVTALIGAGLVAAYLATDGPTAGLIASGAPVLTAIAVVFMVVTGRPSRSGPWLLVAVGCAMVGGAGAAGALELSTDPDVGLPGAAAMFGVLAFPSLFVGAAGITSARRGTR
ncbi:MAG: hypothetical protein ACO23O_09905, partial [Ilumatobacteraceae bacterium]